MPTALAAFLALCLQAGEVCAEAPAERQGFGYAFVEYATETIFFRPIHFLSIAPGVARWMFRHEQAHLARARSGAQASLLRRIGARRALQAEEMLADCTAARQSTSAEQEDVIAWMRSQLPSKTASPHPPWFVRIETVSFCGDLPVK